MTCSYADCRVPPERHDECAAKSISKCWGKLEHQHVPKRSQTPRDERECPVMLCSGHHGGMDCSGRYEGLRLRDGIENLANGRRIYIIWDRADSPESLDPLVEIELSDTGGGDPPSGAKITTDGGPSSPPPMPGSSE